MRAGRHLLAVVVGAALAVSGCAGVPDSGPVTRVGEAGTDDDVDTVFDPGGPSPGASPVEIVQGFYAAMLDSPLSTEAAQEYLTERARETWEPGRRTVVYQTEVRPRQLGPGLVEAWISKLGTLDDSGRYLPTPPSQADETSQLLLNKEHGQWRIANPPDALYVDDYFFERSYDPFSLYFLSPSRDTMVPDPIYLPTDLQPATALIQSLLRGPPPSWRGQLGTAVPSGTDLEGSVPITDEVAEVRLEGPITELSAQAQRVMSAQLVLTLAQLAHGGPVPELEGVRIFANGVPLTIPGVPAVQGLDKWSVLDPSLTTTRKRLYALSSGRLVEVDQRDVSKPLADSLWGARPQGVRSFEVNIGLDRVVAVSADGTRLLTGPLYDSAGLSPRVLYANGQDLATPVATIGQEWLVVDRRARGASRLLIYDGSRVRGAPMGGLEHYRVESLSLSPDGMRFVALARSATPQGYGAPQIMTGKVLRSRDGADVVSLIEPHALVVSGETLADVSSVGWYDSTTLAVLGRRDGSRDVETFTMRIDGSELATPWLLPDAIHPTRLSAVAIEQRAYLTDAQGRVWMDVSGQWIRIEAARLDALNFAG